MAIEGQVLGNNTVGEAFASAARVATPTAVRIANLSARGIEVIIDTTAITATPSVVFSIKSVDRTTGKAVTLLASAAVVATGTIRLVVYPGIAVAANLAANDVIGRDIEIAPVHGDADSITYQVGFTLLP